MNVFTRLQTLMRAGLRESAEAITDANALRIYQQEIVDAEQMLIHRREALARMIAGRRELEEDIEATRQSIASRESQLQRVPEVKRTEALLELAARDIAKTESMLQQYEQGHQKLCEKIEKEEIVLRGLLREIKEHRREIKLLEADLRRQQFSTGTKPQHTVSGKLAALRDTRNAIGQASRSSDHAEDSMAEALERVEGAALDKQLKRSGQSDEDHHIAQVLARLKSGFAAT